MPNSKFKIQNSNIGQLMIEAIVSIAIIMSGLVGIIMLLSSSLGLNRVISNRYVAIYLASEGIEVMRSIVDANINKINSGVNGVSWNDEVMDCLIGIVGAPGISCGGNKGCAINYDDNTINNSGANSPNRWSRNPIKFNGSFYSHNNANDPATPFTRNVCVRTIPSEPDILEVESIVTWTGRGGVNSNVYLVDRFYDTSIIN